MTKHRSDGYIAGQLFLWGFLPFLVGVLLRQFSPHSSWWGYYVGLGIGVVWVLRLWYLGWVKDPAK